MKKLLSVILVSIIAICSCFSLIGCGSGDYGEYDPDNFLTLEEATALGTPNKIVKEPVVIKVFVPKGDSNPSYKTMKMFQILANETNLAFEFIEAQSDQYTNMRNAMWQDKESSGFPDLFLFNNNVSELVQYSEFGALTPFNDPTYMWQDLPVGSLIDEYMPTLKSLLENNFNLDTPKTAEEILTLNDGKIYSAPSVNDVPRDLTTKFYVNQKWIDELNALECKDNPLPNASDIRTIEELDRVLRAFKTYNASGKNETIPLITDNLADVRNYVLSSYGYVSNTVEINQNGDGFVYVPKEDAYRKYLQIMNDWYKDGILENSTAFSSDTSIIRSKGSAGVVGAFCGAAAYLIVGERYGEQGEDWYKTAGPFTSAYYTGTPLQFSRPRINLDGAAIPSSTPYAREIARLLDVMYSTLGQSLSAFGEEGVDWEWKEEGVSWAKKIPSTWTKTEEDYRATLTPNVGLGVSLYNSYTFVGKEVAAVDGEICVTDKLNKLAERYMPYLKEPIPSYVKLRSIEDYNTENKIGVTLQDKVKEYEYKFINKNGGKNPYNDEHWNAYVQDLIEYKCNDWLALYEGTI